MQNLLEISQLSRNQIELILQRAFFFKHHKQYPIYSKHTVAHLFYENSTRTRISFEIAARRLSMQVIQLDLPYSSETKGEIIEDTVRTLIAMDIHYFIIRHQQDGLPQSLVDNLGPVFHLINAGDGTHAHPSQALLDMMTIIEHKPQLDQLKIVILGNIKHSRVANSFQCLCAQLGVGELVLVSPDVWQPKRLHYGRVTNNLHDGIMSADVVICLRVQRERLVTEDYLDLDAYCNDFSLTQKALSYAKPDVMVMHPGPMNRGLEISSDVADGSHSLILKQVHNGVYMRMAIFDALIDS